MIPNKKSRKIKMKKLILTSYHQDKGLNSNKKENQKVLKQIRKNHQKKKKIPAECGSMAKSTKMILKP